MSDPIETTEAGDEPELASRRPRTKGLMLGLALGVALGLVLLVAGLALFARDATPAVTEEALSAAERRWAERGPKSYRLDLVLTGSQTGTIHIEVRDRQVASMTRDGRSPRQRRTWEYWTVPNQFGMIRQDMANAKAPQQAFGVSEPSQVLLRARFDPRYGYPAYYQRAVMGGSNQVEWRITRFVDLDQPR